MLATERARPKTIPAAQVQPSACASSVAEEGRGQALDDGAGDGHAAHRQQLLEVELQADAEHQQDDADLRELLGHLACRPQSPVCVDRARPGQQIAGNG